MPYTNIPADKQDEMEACVVKLVGEGKDKQQAIAICATQILQSAGGPKDGPPKDGPPTPPQGKSSEEMFFVGDAVKQLSDDGRVGGYLVLFTNDGSPDLEGEYFTKDTDFGEVNKYPVMYNHGMDRAIKNKRIGTADVKADEFGLWAEAQLNMRDDYEKFVFELVKRGKIGWSSGSASHTVEREKTEKSFWIKQWYIAEASLTPTPAEYRNSVTTLKSLGAGAQIETLIIEEVNEINHSNEVKNMPHNEPNENANKEADGVKLTKEELNNLVNQASQKTINDLMEKLPEDVKGFNVKVVKDEADREFDSIADQMKAIKTYELNDRHDMDPRLKRLKAPLGLNEGVPSQGGFMLEPTLTAEFLKPVHETGPFSSMVRKLPVSAKSNSGWINGVDETTRADGGRFGGVQGYWRPESGSITASKPKFKRINWELRSLEVLAYVTDEQLEDGSMTAEIVRMSAGEELNFLVNDAILNGDGVGKPLGVLNSPALISVTRTDANTILNADLLSMWQRLMPTSRAKSAWFINSEVEPKLDSLYLTTSLEARYVTYGPDSVMRIKGRPVIVTEFNSALGSVGDILLADMSDYLLWEKGGVKSSVNPWIQWLTGEQAFKFTYRVDGQPASHSAITPYKGSATQSPYVALTASS